MKSLEQNPLLGNSEITETNDIHVSWKVIKENRDTYGDFEGLRLGPHSGSRSGPAPAGGTGVTEGGGRRVGREGEQVYGGERLTGSRPLDARLGATLNERTTEVRTVAMASGDPRGRGPPSRPEEARASTARMHGYHHYPSPRRY